MAAKSNASFSVVSSQELGPECSFSSTSSDASILEDKSKDDFVVPVPKKTKSSSSSCGVEPSTSVVHWDGKLMPDITGKKKAERIQCSTAKPAAAPAHPLERVPSGAPVFIRHIGRRTTVNADPLRAPPGAGASRYIVIYFTQIAPSPRVGARAGLRRHGRRFAEAPPARRSVGSCNGFCLKLYHNGVASRRRSAVDAEALQQRTRKNLRVIYVTVTRYRFHKLSTLNVPHTRKRRPDKQTRSWVGHFTGR
ncbi:hypothetical protein EVAR_24229_1 [Eumeta japonica]|uniref:Uncharacterized protein n=1 Tax=Eumeta variegata TaxID=151549 RepID=A0A4C1W7B6_EUMVA|nr:hypothetical protein EVAR_24229_1 [Eumeta japonica]